WRDPNARAAYAGRVATRRSQVEDQLRRSKVDRMDVEISRGLDRDMVARPILKFFRMREQRRAKR
ncbi:MAG: hypothetical protein ACYTGV_14210, partial [Planctomycetota bacterium]